MKIEQCTNTRLSDPLKGSISENHRAPAEKVPEEQLACGKGFYTKANMKKDLGWDASPS